MGMPNEWPPSEITKPKLLLVEGADAHYVCMWALQALGITDTQVSSYGGIDELRSKMDAPTMSGKLRWTKLAALKGRSGFSIVRTLAILRDAEDSATAALSSVLDALKDAELPVPRAAGEFAPGSPRTGVFLFTAMRDAEGKPHPGTLEDMCLATVAEQPVMRCVDPFLDCAASAGCDLGRRHKARLHAYLAANDKLVGLKIGEAARAGAWDWGHPAMRPFREFLQAL